MWNNAEEYETDDDIIFDIDQRREVHKPKNFNKKQYEEEEQKGHESNSSFRQRLHSSYFLASSSTPFNSKSKSTSATHSSIHDTTSESNLAITLALLHDTRLFDDHLTYAKVISCWETTLANAGVSPSEKVQKSVLWKALDAFARVKWPRLPTPTDRSEMLRRRIEPLLNGYMFHFRASKKRANTETLNDRCSTVPNVARVLAKHASTVWKMFAAYVSFVPCIDTSIIHAESALKFCVDAGLVPAALSKAEAQQIVGTNAALNFEAWCNLLLRLAQETIPTPEADAGRLDVFLAIMQEIPWLNLSTPVLHIHESRKGEQRRTQTRPSVACVSSADYSNNNSNNNKTSLLASSPPVLSQLSVLVNSSPQNATTHTNSFVDSCCNDYESNYEQYTRSHAHGRQCVESTEVSRGVNYIHNHPNANNKGSQLYDEGSNTTLQALSQYPNNIKGQSPKQAQFIHDEDTKSEPDSSRIVQPFECLDDCVNALLSSSFLTSTNHKNSDSTTHVNILGRAKYITLVRHAELMTETFCYWDAANLYDRVLTNAERTLSSNDNVRLTMKSLMARTLSASHVHHQARMHRTFTNDNNSNQHENVENHMGNDYPGMLRLLLELPPPLLQHTARLRELLENDNLKSYEFESFQHENTIGTDTASLQLLEANAATLRHLWERYSQVDATGESASLSWTMYERLLDDFGVGAVRQCYDMVAVSKQFECVESFAAFIDVLVLTSRAIVCDPHCDRIADSNARPNLSVPTYAQNLTRLFREMDSFETVFRHLNFSHIDSELTASSPSVLSVEKASRHALETQTATHLSQQLPEQRLLAARAAFALLQTESAQLRELFLWYTRQWGSCAEKGLPCAGVINLLRHAGLLDSRMDQLTMNALINQHDGYLRLEEFAWCIIEIAVRRSHLASREVEGTSTISLSHEPRDELAKILAQSLRPLATEMRCDAVAANSELFGRVRSGSQTFVLTVPYALDSMARREREASESIAKRSGVYDSNVLQRLQQQTDVLHHIHRRYGSTKTNNCSKGDRGGSSTIGVSPSCGKDGGGGAALLDLSGAERMFTDFGLAESLWQSVISHAFEVCNRSTRNMEIIAAWNASGSEGVDWGSCGLCFAGFLELLCVLALALGTRVGDSNGAISLTTQAKDCKYDAVLGIEHLLRCMDPHGLVFVTHKLAQEPLQELAESDTFVQWPECPCNACCQIQADDPEQEPCWLAHDWLALTSRITDTDMSLSWKHFVRHAKPNQLRCACEFASANALSTADCVAALESLAADVFVPWTIREEHICAATGEGNEVSKMMDVDVIEANTRMAECVQDILSAPLSETHARVWLEQAQLTLAAPRGALFNGNAVSTMLNDHFVVLKHLFTLHATSRGEPTNSKLFQISSSYVSCDSLIDMCQQRSSSPSVFDEALVCELVGLVKQSSPRQQSDVCDLLSFTEFLKWILAASWVLQCFSNRPFDHAMRVRMFIRMFDLDGNTNERKQPHDIHNETDGVSEVVQSGICISESMGEPLSVSSTLNQKNHDIQSLTKCGVTDLPKSVYADMLMEGNFSVPDKTKAYLLRAMHLFTKPGSSKNTACVWWGMSEWLHFAFACGIVNNSLSFTHAVEIFEALAEPVVYYIDANSPNANSNHPSLVLGIGKLCCVLHVVSSIMGCPESYVFDLVENSIEHWPQGIDAPILAMSSDVRMLMEAPDTRVAQRVAELFALAQWKQFITNTEENNGSLGDEAVNGSTSSASNNGGRNTEMKNTDVVTRAGVLAALDKANIISAHKLTSAQVRVHFDAVAQSCSVVHLPPPDLCKVALLAPLKQSKRTSARHGTRQSKACASVAFSGATRAICLPQFSEMLVRCASAMRPNCDTSESGRLTLDDKVVELIFS